MLTEDEQKRITPPFTDGGIREWGEGEERNKGDYRKGPAPLQMDFKNYTLRQLVKNDLPPDEDERVERNIYWRVYDLGYSLESFGEIDSWLLNENYRKYSRSADGRKTDRYGKKYSWIAFYELAGFRQDKGLIWNFNEDVCILEADIDPSFPAEEHRHNLIKEDFLGDKEKSTKEWVSKNYPPDLTSYLKIDTLYGEQGPEQGPWILLRGHMNQQNKQDNRNVFAFFEGLIVKSEEVDEIVETLKKQEKINAEILPSVWNDYSTYAGEIPWCDTYPENGWKDVSFKIGSVLVPEERLVLQRDDEPISDTELYEFRNSIADLIEEKNTEAIETQLRERGLKLTTQTIKVEQQEYRTFKMLVPVRDNTWGDSLSAAVPGRNITTPAKEIAETLNLYGYPQSFDLFDKDGRRASITFRYGENWGEMQHFTYLRQDLLERYLAEIGGELIWTIWGERSLMSQNVDVDTLYKHFQDVKVYRHIKSED